MTRNWYAVYTKPQHEKKVAALLSKRGIHNYYPVNKVTRQSISVKKPLRVPLFTSMVFVYVTEQQLLALKKLAGITHIIYWLSKPAIIHDEEIDVLQQFTSVYQNIKLERSKVNVMGMVRVIDDPIISFKENSATIRFQTLKVILPSLGYTMITEREKISEDTLQMVSRSSLFNKQVNPTFHSN